MILTLRLSEYCDIHRVNFWPVIGILHNEVVTSHNSQLHVSFKVLIYVLFYLPCTVKPVMGDHLLRRERSHKKSALSKRTLERHTLSPVIKGYLLPGYNNQNDGLEWQEISHKAGHSTQVLPYPVLCLGTSKSYKIKMFDSYVEKNKLHNNQRPLCIQPPVPYPSSKTISGPWAWGPLLDGQAELEAGCTWEIIWLKKRVTLRVNFQYNEVNAKKPWMWWKMPFTDWLLFFY